MSFNLKDLGAAVTKLLSRADEQFKAEITDLKTKVDSAISGVEAQLSDAKAALAGVTTALKSALTGAKIETKSDATAGDMVSQLSARITTLENSLSDSLSTVNAFNKQLTEACLSGNLLELRGADGKPLPADASAEDKAKAAESISIGDKFKAYQGALNAAFAKGGVPNNTMPKAPATPPAAASEKATKYAGLKGAKLFEAITAEEMAAGKKTN